MTDPVLALPAADWSAVSAEPGWAEAVEAGRVLYFPGLAFALAPAEARLLGPELLARGARNISLDAAGQLKGAAADPATQAAVASLVGRFARQARGLVQALFPAYDVHLRPAPTSLRPTEVATRKQSVRADDRRMHVDAFPTRPNRGERILRVFSNIDPLARPRVWRIGEPFEDVARRFLPQAKPYSPLQAGLLRKLRLTKSLRSEYDHLMLQLHDAMKADEDYQRSGRQWIFDFPAGSTWVCFSDQTVHAAVSGQNMLEQTFHLPVQHQYDPGASPLAILNRLTGRVLA